MSTLGYVTIILYQDVNVTIPCLLSWHGFKRSAEVNKRRREDTARLEAAKSQVQLLIMEMVKLL